MSTDLGLDEIGLNRLSKISTDGGVVSPYWINRMIVEIRLLRAENERLDRERSKAIKDIQEYANLTDLDIQVALDGMP